MTEKRLSSPLRGMVALGASGVADLRLQVEALCVRVQSGQVSAGALPTAAFFRSPARLVVDFANGDDLRAKLPLALRATEREELRALANAQGIYWGSGAAGERLAFLFPGQGGQYVGMGQELAASVPAFAGTLAEADRAMLPLLGFCLCKRFLAAAGGGSAVDDVERDFSDVSVVQPAIIALSTAIARLLHNFGIRPDFVFGHSLGEYSGLVEVGALQYAQALQVVSLLHPAVREATVKCGGALAAVIAPESEVIAALKTARGRAVLANINSEEQYVIGGPEDAVEQVREVLHARGFDTVGIPATHAFHTPETRPIAEAMRTVLDCYDVRLPRVPVIAGTTGRPYPGNVRALKALLAHQAAATVQWARGIGYLYQQGVRTFVEVGPKRALKGFVDSLLGKHGDVQSLFTCHPKTGELVSFNRALCGLFAAGFGGAETSDEAESLDECGGNSGTRERRVSETSGVLAGGSLARRAWAGAVPGGGAIAPGEAWERRKPCR